MRILGLDSSGLVASVAIVTDGIMMAEYTVNYKKTHSQTLLPMLDEIVRMCEVDLQTVDVVAVAAGPGSFTGLRIGSATAKGLAQAFDKPIVPVPTTAGLAYNLYGTDALICPIMDARRSQVYNGLYLFRGEEFVTRCEQRALGVRELVQELNSIKPDKVIFLGDGVEVYRELLEEQLDVPHFYAPPHLSKQRAGAIAALGEKLFQEGTKERAAEHVPIYLRPSQAEREQAKKENVKKCPANLVVRPMTEADVVQVAALEQATFSLPWSEESFYLELEQEAHCFLVAAIPESMVVGYCGFWGVVDEAQITNVAVKKEFRNRGIGKKMMKELIAEGIRRKLSVFTLEVRASNMPAIHLYQSLGYKEVGRRKNFYQYPVEDAILMTLDKGE